ncbi:unnamed protein product [Darwinula stevensoni]|uniref:Sphingomyelin synthase-like domain-containing protein n=1 Tax=Darwinula stevensoni TaxID=69355 RepID=A0A7R8XIH4_9CRUS|nr:unnamed protein product [Darwinula stevensoni]CAG0893858.1 unnamed protein product [Darwinula stevensoni]
MEMRLTEGGSYGSFLTAGPEEGNTGIGSERRDQEMNHPRATVISMASTSTDDDDDTSSDQLLPYNHQNGYHYGYPDENFVPLEGSKPQRKEPKFPKEKLKTLACAVWFFMCGVMNMTFLALVHDRVPKNTPPLPDIFLDNVQTRDWALSVSEYILMGVTYSTLILIFMHKHRWIVFRRVFFIMGLLYLMRSITFFVTVLPVANPNYKCNPQSNDTTPAVILQRVVYLCTGFGLSISGHHTYCGDYIFSGHTMILVLGYLIMREYSPKGWWVLHYAVMGASISGVIFLLISRGHYLVDVILAYYITTRLFWIYHTLANNPTLRKASNAGNNLANECWYPVFLLLERNVNGVLPRKYSWPIPGVRYLCRIKRTAHTS